jgi:hypothetical protein
MNEGVSDLFNGPIVIPTPKKLTWSNPNAASSVGRRGPRTRGFSPAALLVRIELTLKGITVKPRVATPAVCKKSTVTTGCQDRSEVRFQLV